MSLNPTASYYLMSQPAAKLSDVETDIKKVLERLADGDGFVKYEEDATLFVGKSGTGTTTLLAHLTTDNSKLEVKRDGAKVIIEGQAISRTIFPTLLGSGAHHYYDCPSFTNSQNLVDDITATYFVKKVVDQASRLRMVLVAEYSLFETDSCDGLTEQFSYIIGTIKNIGALRACMGMVVTKVPIDGQSDGQAAIKKIGDKLVSYKSMLDERFYEFIDMLTEKDKDGLYHRLAVFFVPPAPSSSTETLTLDKIPLLLDEKPKIELMVNNLSFIDRQMLDIQFDFPHGSFDLQHELRNKLGRTIDELMKSVGTSLKSFLNSMVESNDDVYDLRSRLQTNVDALKNLVSALVNMEDTKIFERGLTSYLPALKIGAPQATLVEVSRYLSYLQFIVDVDRLDFFTMKPSARTKHIRDVIEHYEDELSWSDFLIGLFEDLSRFGVQKDRSRYIDQVDAYDYSAFLIKLKEVNAPSYVTERLCRLSPTTRRLAQLNKVLELTLRQEVTWEPELKQEEVEVQTCKAPVVRVGEILYKLRDWSLWKHNFKTLRIFASHKVILDEDINLGGKKVSILAPALELVGDRKVDVSGVIFKGDRGMRDTGARHGEDGQDGGRVLLVSMNYDRNCELSVLANGKTGEAGQDGVVVDGKDGIDAPPSHSGTKPYKFEYEYRGSTTIIEQSAFKGIALNYYVYGSPGEPGTSGARGGDGGAGGNSGFVVVDGVLANISAKPGKGGEGGSSKGGQGGWDGRNRLHSYNNYLDRPSRWFRGILEDRKTRARSGAYGRDGDPGSPGKTVAVNGSELLVDLNAYKNYMLEWYGEGILRSQLVSFSRSINRSRDLGELYDLNALCNELLGYQEKHQVTDLMTYEYLRDRIEQFSEPKRNLTDDEKKCLRYLYTATQTEICRLRSSKDKYLVINVKGYLEVALASLDQLKTSRAARIISDLRAKFGDEITRLVQEANDLINAHLPKEIDEAMAEMKTRIEGVLDQVSDKEEQLKKDKAELEKLKYYAVAMFVLDIQLALSALLGVFGPLGVVAAFGVAVINQVERKIVDEIVKPDVDRPDHITKIPEAVKNAKNYTSKAIKDEKERIVSEADELKTRIERMRKVLAPKQLESYASINTLTADDQSSLSPAEADRQLGQALQDLSSVNEQSTSSLTELNQTVTKAETKVNKVAGANEMFKGEWEKGASEGKKVFKEINDHADKYKAKSDKISKALAEVNESLKNLDAYKKKIREETLPMIDNLGKQMSQVQDQLIGQSQAALDIAKWNIGGCLSDMKFYLKGVTKDFKGEEEVGRTVMKVDAAITTMISIFDRIQNYQSQARMADHIADVAAVGFDTIDIADPKLKELAVKMRINMQESLVLERYGACYSAFRQWTFPLAYAFLPTVTLPDGFKDAADLSPSDDLKSMLDVVNRYNASIVPEDRMMERDEFDTDAGELPFYTWPNASIRASIVNLLSGKEIRLLADIRNSPPGKDAIKFIRLGIKFRLDDKDRSEKLHSLLNGFKLSLLHSGTSYYRVRQEFYQIQSASVEIRCKLRTKADGSPVGRNAVYDKLLTGDQMLSPYTLWTIKLIKNNPRVTYESLESFKDVDLELVGEGWSFDTAQSTVDFQLDKYGYQRADFPLSIC